VALRDAGVSEVVYATADPDPQAAGGAAYLAANGVPVTGGVLDAWAAEQNLVFLHGVRQARPHVTLKLAHTRSGALAAPQGRWVTGEPARTAVHGMRALVDAVLVGSGTVIADDPRLDVRHVPLVGPAPRAVVLDGRGRSPLDAKVIREGTIVVTGNGSDAMWRSRLQEQGCDVVVVPGPEPAPPVLDLAVVMRELWFRGIRAILAEPGASLAAALLAAGVVDALVTYVADTTPEAEVRPPDAIAAARDWTVRRRLRRGPDLEIERRPPAPPNDED
jgi:diaminohydroxyphosphoribosylaminopyrimidine deaminase/5-amino-6-(5-phosphoribosylamino)uracil reductase